MREGQGQPHQMLRGTWEGVVGRHPGMITQTGVVRRIDRAKDFIVTGMCAEVFKIDLFREDTRLLCILLMGY